MTRAWLAVRVELVCSANGRDSPWPVYEVTLMNTVVPKPEPIAVPPEVGVPVVGAATAPA
jgi:hypothetical protein